MKKINCYYNFKEKQSNFRGNILHLFQFLLTVLLIPAAASAQWSTQSPVPTHLDVRGIGAPASQRVFVATDDNSFDDGGALFESTDGGATWVQLNIPASLGSPFNGLFFLDTLNGWAFGNENYRTADGGTTWTQLPFLGSTYFMEFYTPSLGLASGNFDVQISMDGGGSWNPSPNDIFDFDFSDALNGLGVSETGIYKTTDGSITFTPVYSGNAHAAEFLTAGTAAGIVDSTFIRSTDGGATWTPGSSADGRTSLLAVSANIVIAWGRSGTFPDYDDRVFRSTDAGQTWTDLGEIIPEGVLAFALADAQTITASDQKGNIFYSADAGLTWSQSFTSPGPLPGFLSSASPVFATPLIGYFGYGGGFVIKTTDGGATWFQISSGTGQTLNDIARFPNGNMIAVGDNGTLLTSNGTTPWIIQKAVTTLDLKAVQVIGPSEAVLLDEDGRVYKSIDGGNSWTAADSVPSGLSAEDLHFTTLLDGWITGSGFSTGALFHTTDGGNTWSAVQDFMGAYTAVDVSGTNIWAANVTGLYYRSTDGGNTWIAGNLPVSPLQVKDMEFFNESIGYAVSWWGYAFRTDDGGNTWQELPTPNDDNFTDIYLAGANELWVSSNNNNIYYSNDGGQGWALLEIGSAGFGNFEAITANSDGDAWTVGYQGYIEHFSGPPPPPLNQPPAASFSYTASGLTVNFTDTSIDPDGFIVSWAWDFGDSSFSTQQNPEHTFDTAGTYIVRLTVTDDDSASGSTLQIIAVQPGPGGTYGDFTEVTPLDSLFVTPQDEDFWVITTAPADFDGDNDLDIAVLGYYVVYNQSVVEKLVLLRNDGPSDSTHWGFAYIDVPLGTLTAGASDLAWGDADGDGDVDLAVGTDGATVIYRNDAGTLELSDTELPGYYEENSQADFDLRSITWNDFDNDGDLDLLIPSVFNDTAFTFQTSLMRNDGPNGTGGLLFTGLDSVFASTSHAQSAWADYDGDQDLDLLLVNIAPLTEDGFIRIYKNDGGGTFTGEDILGTLTIEHGEAQWGDYDSDGDLDILIAGHIKELNGTYNTALRIYRNDSTAYFPIEVIECVPCEGWFDLTAASWGDYDSDGDMDILLAGTYNSGSQIEGRARVYKNTNGVFTDSGSELPAPRAAGDRGGTFSWVDIDGDGDLDYFIAGQYFVPGGNGLVEAQMHLYRNDVNGENNAPSLPGNLTAVHGDNIVLLSWTPAGDDHTPAAALTYDLELFSDSIPVNIPNRLPEPGNISAAVEWSLSGLQDGHYEWTLRAVDAAYIGGQIASGAFDIGITSVEPGNLPVVYSLSQNYPNPFNPTTSIKYSIPYEGLVTLRVYNAIGEEAAVLINEFKHSGSHEVSFDASKLSSGMYLYQLQSGSFIQTKKMILLK